MKNFFNRLGILGWLFVATTAIAAGIGGSILIIGEDTLTGDVEIHMREGRIRWNDTDNVLQFSNDSGSQYKDIGAGGGGGGVGGVNILANPGFEDGVGAPEWSVSGVVATQEAYGEPAPNNEFFARMDFGAASQHFESAATTKPDSLGEGCSVQFEYNGGDENIDIVVLDGATELLRRTLVARTSWGKIAPIHFPCSASMKARFEATADAALFEVDNVYVGSTLGLSNISSVQLAGQSAVLISDQCIWSRTSTTIGVFTADSDCPGPVIEQQFIGDWQTTDTDLPEQTINNLPAGRYEIVANFPGSATTVSAVQNYRISDGTNNGVRCTRAHSGSSVSNVTCKLIVDYTALGNRTFRLEGDSSSGPVEIKSPAGAVNGYMSWVIKRYALESETTFLAQTNEFYIQGKMDGVAIALAAGSEPSLQGLANSNLVLQPEIGNAEISCFSAVPEGTTCSGGTESVGIAFVAPVAGIYNVCFDFNHQSTNNGATATNYFIERRELNDGAAIELGQTHRFFSRQVNGHDFYDMQTLCNRFTIGSAGKVRFDIKYTKTAGSGNFQLQNSGSNDDRRLQYRVELVRNQVETPILVGGQVYTPGLGAKRIKKFTVIFGQEAIDGDQCTSSPCEIFVERGGDWINGNVTRVAGGQYNFTTNAVFKPNEHVECYCQGTGDPFTAAQCNIGSISGGDSAFRANGSGVLTFDNTNARNIFTRSPGGVAVDSRVNFTCYSEE